MALPERGPTEFSLLLEMTGLTQAEAAGYLRVSYGAVVAWCQGLRHPRPQSLDQMSALIRQIEGVAALLMAEVDEAIAAGRSVLMLRDATSVEWFGLPVAACYRRALAPVIWREREAGRSVVFADAPNS